MVIHTGLTDSEIIRKVLLGEQSQFAHLVDRYRNYVFTLVLRFTDNREDAEEVAQDIFVKAYRSLADFRGESKFSTWLYTIVRTSCITFLRKRKLETISLENDRSAGEWQDQESALRANRVEQKSRHGMLNDAIRLLGKDDQQVITLFYQAEQSLEEIGRIMGLDPNTVKVKLHRARQRLREKMEKHFSREVREMQGE
ncbi:MAG: sigma-70 family RNA polymerase sigma factor [Bacteroidota bacterium]|nr:sigma-70 family RNA polymerase sigma factor [Bacteroidota bacterium]MDP4247186.1 sigma-70 family RNA polymerase sigma factor [Bacteroidota bacterium]MDP4253157.1 sigma-70 family RNA polymerase sigma factor [Bacteroidota bacterium]MDP4257039.1 sigma-70 family RNA polymerase sigma factor [Bacteroidota bacterium]